MRISFFFTLAVSVIAAPTAVIMGQPTPMQAVMQIRGGSGCTIEVSENPTFAPLHPDVDGTKHSGSSTDTGRADTITQSDGTELVTVGHMNDDRALAAATTYYWRVSACGGTITGNFTTPTIGLGSSQQWPVPFDSTKPWNADFPKVNLLSPDWVVDPETGAKLKPINSALDRTWRTGGPNAGFAWPFQDWDKATSWTSPANILNGSTSTASTTNTNPIDLYGIYDRFLFGNADGAWLGISFDDLGVLLWGSATNQTGTNNQFTICRFTSPVAGCPGTLITVTTSATSGTPAINSASTDPDHAWPNNFPAAFFNAWGLSASEYGPDHVNTQGTLAGCTAGVCTLLYPTAVRHFPNTMVPGQKIFINGSSATCTNSLCTMASYQNANQVTLVEPLNIGAVDFKVYMWGLRIQKVTSTGTLNIGVQFKHAGSLTIGQADASGFANNKNPVTTGDGHTGYIISPPTTTNLSGRSPLYFVSADGTVRSLWNTIVWQSSTCFTPSTAGDLPNVTAFIGQPQPDPSDGRTFLISATTVSGSVSLYKMRYNGDFTEDFSTNYQYSQSGDGPILAAAPCGHWTVVNLTPPSLSLDIPAQIAANWAATPATTPKPFDLAIYPNVAGSWAFSAMVPGYAVYENQYAGGQDAPAWIALVNTTTGVIDYLFDTLTGSGTTSWYGGMRWGGLHTIYNQLKSPTLVIANNAAIKNDPSRLLAGPFEFTPLAKLNSDGVTWNTNTSLPWPIDGTYYNPCPGGNQFAFLGATGTNCVTFKIPTGGACNIAPNALEQSKFPACPWNGSFTAPVPLIAGDVFADFSAGGNCGPANSAFDFNCENFRIISVTSGGGFLTVVAQRNATYDYCAFNPTNFPATAVNNGVLVAASLQHANGWLAAMSASRTSGCYANVFVWNSATHQIVGESSILSGAHSDLIGASASKYTAITSAQARADRPLDNTFQTGLFGYPTTGFALSGPTFAAKSAGIGGIVQSYVESPGGLPWMSDANPYNPSGGTSPEQLLNGIGSITLTPVGGGHTDVYTITPIANGLSLTATNYKTYPFVGWAGRYLLHDISGPSCNIDSANWTFAYILAANECYSGSTANTVVVHVAGAYNGFAYCGTGQSFMIIPCVAFGAPGAGMVRQQRITGPDASGVGSRSVSSLLAIPGAAYPYTHFSISDDATMGFGSAHQIQGWGTLAWLVKLPPWQEDTTNRTQPSGILKLTIPTGLQYAEVKFGYSRKIGPSRSPNLFYCTDRSEACNTSGTPYGFTSETRTLTSCSGGCVIDVPVVPPNVVYYTVGRSSDGTNWSYEDTKAVSIN